MEPQIQKAEISKLTGISESSVYVLDQVHGDTVFDADEVDASMFPEGDAWIGETSGKVLCIKTADCMPLFFGLNKVLSLSRFIRVGRER